MEPLNWSELSKSQRLAALDRPAEQQSIELVKTVQHIFQTVHQQGWTAVSDFALQFDKHGPKRWDVDQSTVKNAKHHLERQHIDALESATKNIEKYHNALRPKNQTIEMDDYVIDRIWKPINPIGLYVPGGSAPLVSTLLMSAIPAKVAGVDEIIVTTPPSADGGPHPMMIVAADLCHLESIWTIGGAQAIAAMAMGTSKIPKCAKIFGPGNAYVAAAKLFATTIPNGPAIDLPAGPSELMIIADENADITTLAWDMLSQAEHDPLAQVIMISDSNEVLKNVMLKIADILQTLPRAKIASAALSFSRFIKVEDIVTAADIANNYAPEHLILNLKALNADVLVKLIDNAGTIFFGPYAAESFGDYIAGPSHILPTNGAARAYGGIHVESFLKPMSIQKMSKRGAKKLSAHAATLARLEGLEAHAIASEIRG